jgi:putative ABC transport system permease protein
MFKKIPTAWLQLRHQKIRLIVALSGVIFAVVIIFMQLGIRDALFDSGVRLHKSLKGDCFLISPRSTALPSLQSFPERRLLQALALEEVDFITPIYVNFTQWRNPQNRKYWRNIFLIGFDIEHQIFDLPGVEENIDFLKLPDVVLFDRNSRKEFGSIVQEFQERGSVTTEISSQGANRKIEVVGLFQLGTSFASDGNLLTSNLNFWRLSSDYKPGFIDIGLIKLKPEATLDRVTQKLKEYLPGDVRVLTKQEFIQFEKNYWQSSTAIGFIFNLGVGLGVIVGVVVVYQILYTNVSEHLAEYATLKAIGYRHRYLLSFVLQQAIFIAVLGYIPGFLLSMIQYQFTKKATLLPIAMTGERAIFVFVAIAIACFVSGAIAVRKLKSADPADIF